MAGPWRGIIGALLERQIMRNRAAFLAVFLIALAVIPAQAADDALSAEANQAFLAANAKKPGVIVRPDGLQFKILQNGFGKRPYLTDTVQVYYTGTLINGTVFDGTSPGLPAQFKVNSVITGWEEALSIMREGDHWQLVIPPTLAYGERGAGNGTIPPNQALIFDLRLIATKPAPHKGDKDYIPDPDDKDDQPQ
jgi:FKBP-type peptidyl-prolyl cis-trans isomerase